jgi:hypothetical protein
MDTEHVNHYERPGVLPIAFTVHHAINIEDSSVNFLMRGQLPIWHRDGWASRTSVAIDNHGKELTVAEMESQRIGNWNAYKEYMHTVFAETESWLESLAPSDLETVLFNGEFPDMFKKAYIARVVQGQAGELVLTGAPGQRWQFTVKSVTPVSVVEDGRNYFRAEAELAGSAAGTALRPNMEGVAKVVVGERSLLWVWTHRFSDWVRSAWWQWTP